MYVLQCYMRGVFCAMITQSQVLDTILAASAESNERQQEHNNIFCTHFTYKLIYIFTLKFACRIMTRALTVLPRYTLYEDTHL